MDNKTRFDNEIGFLFYTDDPAQRLENIRQALREIADTGCIQNTADEHVDPHFWTAERRERVHKALPAALAFYEREAARQRKKPAGGSIGMRVRKATGDYDPGCSKFFGSPTVPSAWEDEFHEEQIFFCQLRLADLAALDTANRLPHRGYLYIFLDIEVFPYQPLVYYFDGEPDMIIDDFNAEEPMYGHLTEEWLIDFYPTDTAAEGNKLFGAPADWSHEEPAPALLLQYDPLDAPMGFLESLDGYAYFFFGEDAASLDDITMNIEQS